MFMRFFGPLTSAQRTAETTRASEVRAATRGSVPDGLESSRLVDLRGIWATVEPKSKTGLTISELSKSVL